MPAHAQLKPIRFGAEWTFTNQSILSMTEDPDFFGENLEELIREKCKKCFKRDGKIYLGVDGIWIRISSDPSVVEITAKPMTTQEMRKHADLIQQLVWESAKEVDLKPHGRIGGGHVHIERPKSTQGFSDVHAARQRVLRERRQQERGERKSLFQTWRLRIVNLFRSTPETTSIQPDAHSINKEALLVRNFVADMMNNGELFLGALGFNLQSAPPLSILGYEVIRGIKETFEKFDKGKMDFLDFFANIRAHYDGRGGALRSEGAYGYSKYQAVNLDHRDTIEVRGIRPQQSFMHYILICEFFEARLNYLARLIEPIKLRIKKYRGFTKRVNGHKYYFSSAKASNVVDTFKRMVRESGLRWIDSKPLLTPAIRDELKKENATPKTRQRRGRARMCKNVFTS